MGTRLLTQRPNKTLNKHQKSRARPRLINQKHIAVRPQPTEIFSEITSRSNLATHFDYNFSQIGVFANEGESSLSCDLRHFESIDIPSAVTPPVGNIQISDPDPQRRTHTTRNLKAIVSGLKSPLGALYIHVDSKARRHTVARGTVGHLEDNHIYLNPERYRSDTSSGRRILAHEMAHATQRQTIPFKGISRDLLEIAAELEAVLIANAYAGGNRFRAPLLPLPAGSIPAFTSVDPVALKSDLNDAFYRAIVREAGIHPSKELERFLRKLKDAFTTGVNQFESVIFGFLVKAARAFIKFPVVLDLRKLPDSNNADFYAHAHLEADPGLQHLKIEGSFTFGFWGETVTVGQHSGDKVQIYIPWFHGKSVHGILPMARVSSQDSGITRLQTGPGKFTSKEIQLDFVALRLPELSDVIKWIPPETPMLRAGKIVFTSSDGMRFDELGLHGENNPGPFSLQIGNILAVEELRLDARRNREEVGPNAVASSGMSLSLSAEAVKFEIPGVDLRILRPEILYDTKTGIFKLSAHSTNEFKFFGASAQLTDIAFEAGPKVFKGGFHVNKGRKEGPRAILNLDSKSISLKNFHVEWKIPILETLTLDIPLIQVGKESAIEGASIGTGLGSVTISKINLPDEDRSSFVQDLIEGKIPVRFVELPLPGEWDGIEWIHGVPLIRISGFKLTSDGLIFEKIGFHGAGDFTLKLGEFITVIGVESYAMRGGVSAQPAENDSRDMRLAFTASAIEFMLPDMLGRPLRISSPQLTYEIKTGFFNLSTGKNPFELLGTPVELHNIFVKRDSKGFSGGFDVRSKDLRLEVMVDSKGVLLNNLHWETNLGSIDVEGVQIGDQPAIIGDIKIVILDETFLVSQFSPSRFIKRITEADFKTLIREIISQNSSRPENKQPEIIEKEGKLLNEEQVAAAKSWYSENSSRYPAPVVIQIQEKIRTKPNGIIGALTIKSIAAWQKEKRLDVDGKAGSTTLVEMFGRDIRSRPAGDRKFETREGTEPKIDAEDASFSDQVIGYLKKFVLFPDLSEEPSTTVASEAPLPAVSEEDKAIVALPRKKRKHKIVSAPKFKRELDGKSLHPRLVNQMEKMANFAIEEDLVTRNIEYTSGMRSTKDAHRMSTAWSIREGRVIRKHLKNFKNSKGQFGVDDDGTRWFDKDWTMAKAKENARKKWSGAKAAEGYPKGDKRRRPNTFSGVTRHATGLAIDVRFPWITSGKVKDPEALEHLKSQIKDKYKHRPETSKKRLQRVDIFVARGSYNELAVDMVKIYRLRRPMLHSTSTEDWHYELAERFKPNQLGNEKKEREQAEKVARESKPVLEVTTSEAKTPEVSLPQPTSLSVSKNADAVLRDFATFLPGTDTYISLDEEGLGNYLAQLSARPELVRAIFDRLDLDDRPEVFQIMLTALSDSEKHEAKSKLPQQLEHRYSNGGGDRTEPEAEVQKPSDICNIRPFNKPQFINKKIKADVDFFPSLERLARFAEEGKMKIFITDSKREPGRKVKGAIVPPASRSNHLVGHAIDMNLQSQSGFFNSKKLKKKNLGKLPREIQRFIGQVRADPILRWGGDFRREDPVHIDDALNNRDRKRYDRKFKSIVRPRIRKKKKHRQ